LARRSQRVKTRARAQSSLLKPSIPFRLRLTCFLRLSSSEPPPARTEEVNLNSIGRVLDSAAMATPVAERFEKIFANIAKPALPDPTQPHIADTELAKSEPSKLKEPDNFKTPDVSQVKRKFLQETRQAARDFIFSSEDEDDYVNGCKNNAKSEMLEKTRGKGRRKPLQGAGSHKGNNKDGQLYSSAALTDSSLPTSMRYPEDFKAGNMINKLPTHDIDGNKAIGHFCILSLVSKFPYKYMKDPSDQVSKRFFAANKFYAREWDM
jgi:hypothetical protein